MGGLGLVIVGFYFMSRPPAEGFLSLTLAPIMQVLGYCVVIPYAIMARGPQKHAAGTVSKGD